MAVSVQKKILTNVGIPIVETRQSFSRPIHTYNFLCCWNSISLLKLVLSSNVSYNAKLQQCPIVGKAWTIPDKQSTDGELISYDSIWYSVALLILWLTKATDQEVILLMKIKTEMRLHNCHVIDINRWGGVGGGGVLCMISQQTKWMD